MRTEKTEYAAASGLTLSKICAALRSFSTQNHNLLEIPNFLATPVDARRRAALQKFANLTPQYPGVRAPLGNAVCASWLESLSPLLTETFGPPRAHWEMQAWYSLVTTPPGKLMPIQRFPHVDGTDPRQIAMMLYLHDSPHGGTAFFRHRTTGFEALTAETFPVYRAALEADVARTGLPEPAYPTDGAPHFQRIHASTGSFNSAVFYRGNILHSGVIDNAAPLSADPRIGRLTINGFFRPV
jgi:hypothetical protein